MIKLRMSQLLLEKRWIFFILQGGGRIKANYIEKRNFN